MLEREQALRIVELASKLQGRERALADAFIQDPMADLGDLGIRAGYHPKMKGQTRKRRAAESTRVTLSRQRVRDYIAAIMGAEDVPEEQAITKTVLPLVATAEEVKQRLTRIARISMAEMLEFDDTGRWTGEVVINRDNADALKELDIEERQIGAMTIRKIRPKIEDRMRALQALAQIHGLIKQPEDARRDEVVAAAWAKVFALHPEVAKAYHFALLEANPERSMLVDVTPSVPVNGQGHV